MSVQNPTAGDILKYEFLDEFGIPVDKAPTYIQEIVSGKSRVSPETDSRLCSLFCVSSGYFLRLQEAHDKLANNPSAASEDTANLSNTTAGTS